ncbi:GldM family protein [Hymenobacter terrigena]
MLLPVPRLRAQGRPLGPWRLTHQLVSERDWEGWEPKTAKKVLQFMPVAVKWNVVPDSIRLFLGCENPLIAPSPPRKGQLPIRFSATGATVRVDAKSRRLLIVPTAATVTLWAHKGQALVFKHQFKAIPAPLPILEVFCSTVSATVCFGQRPDSTSTRALTIKAIPARSFASLLPDDARYRVSRYTVTCLRNGVAFGTPRKVDGPQASLAEVGDFQEGDRLQIDVQLVQRMNFRREVESLTMQKQFNVPLFFLKPPSGVPSDSTSGW